MLQKLAVVSLFMVLIFTSKLSIAQQKKPTIVFQTQIHHFDTIQFNQPVSYYFSFKNTGKEKLIIKKVISDCHCTTFEWDDAPVKKNKKGKIKVTFKANTKGLFNKTILVETNAQNANLSLAITGFVK
jgi:hypothetical protein